MRCLEDAALATTTSCAVQGSPKLSLDALFIYTLSCCAFQGWLLPGFTFWVARLHLPICTWTALTANKPDERKLLRHLDNYLTMVCWPGCADRTCSLLLTRFCRPWVGPHTWAPGLNERLHLAGCDALAVHLLLTTVAGSINLGGTWKAVAASMAIMVPWGFAHWEEYHDGTMLYGNGYWGITEANYALVVLHYITVVVSLTYDTWFTILASQDRPQRHHWPHDLTGAMQLCKTFLQSCLATRQLAASCQLPVAMHCAATLVCTLGGRGSYPCANSALLVVEPVKLAIAQGGPGLWRYNLQEVLPQLPISLHVNDALLLVVYVAGTQQLGGQIWRTLFTSPSVRFSKVKGEGFPGKGVRLRLAAQPRPS